MTHSHGRKALVVDDEPLIAVELESLLLDAGYEDVTILASVEEALAVLEDWRPDVAILDVKLRDAVSIAVATTLSARGIPFIVHSGYAQAEVDERFRGGIWLAKPATETQIRDVLSALDEACR